MKRLTMRSNIVLVCIGLALAAIVALAGCAPQKASDVASSDANADAASTSAEAGFYVSDEQCMSCHGGSYEAVAELTADLGDWNPHDSLHGGYNSCVNCHAKDNYCTQCHVYAPDEEPLY